MSRDPSDSQLRLLEAIRKRLRPPLLPGEVDIVTRWQHWEDEELGFAPLGTQGHLAIRGAPFSLRVMTAWEDRPKHIEATAHCYDTGRDGGEPWAVLLTSEVRRAFAKLGFADLQTQRFTARWRDTTPARRIAGAIERAARIPMRVLRPSDLSLDVDPRLHHWVVGLLGADALIGWKPAGERIEIVLESGGERQTCEVDPDVADFVRRWYAGATASSDRR